MTEKLIDTTGELERRGNKGQGVINPYEELPFCDDWDNEKRQCIDLTTVPCPYYDIEYEGFCKYREDLKREMLIRGK